jgi:[ribosomal protein S5]-alanine N-acetyltransferase
MPTFEGLPLPIRTTRLTIRAHNIADIPDWLSLNGSESERKWFGGVLRKSEPSVAEGIALKRGHVDEQLTISDRQSGAFVGQCGFLCRITVPQELELYCILKQSQHGKGLGSEVCAAMIETALRPLARTWVTGIIHPDNVACIKMVRSLGFDYVGPYEDPSPFGRQQGHSLFAVDRERFEAATSRQPTILRGT